jgi:Bardet-Biedl syndrome 7 protein
MVTTRTTSAATAALTSSSSPLHTSASTVAVATVSPVQHGGKRLEIHLWADEGIADTLQVTAYSGQAPRTAQIKYVPLYALPLYERVSSDSAAAAGLAPAMQQAMSRWIVLGSFTGQDMLGWMGQLLPDLDDMPHRATTHRHVFVSDFLQSTLVVELDEVETGSGGDSRAVFSCNSLVTLATVKRHVSQACAQLGLTITTREHVLFQTAQRQLQQLYPMLTSLSSSQRRLQLLQGLRELQGAEKDLSFLPSQLQEVLASAEEVEVEAEAESHQEAYLKRAVVAIYRSLVFFKGHAPPLSDAVRTRLEAASCGCGFDAALLERLFFPRGEQCEEGATLEANGGGSLGRTHSLVKTVTTPTLGNAAVGVGAANASAIGVGSPTAATAAAPAVEDMTARYTSEVPSAIISSPSASEGDEL